MSVDTAFEIGRARDRPLEIVGDLVAAFFPNTAPNELGQYTLHLPEGVDISSLSADCFADSGKTTLRTGLPLTSLNGLGLDHLHPLIIRSLNDTITIDDYMKIELPLARYHDRLPDASSTEVSIAVSPKVVSSWVNFESDVQDWVNSNQRLERIKKPLFIPFEQQQIIAEEVPQLQPFLNENLLNNASNCSSGCTFQFWSLINNIEANSRGKPDFGMLRDNKLVAPIEIKGKWTLPHSDIVNDSNTYVKKAIIQIFTYMVQNWRKYGILSTYDYTWFCYRSGSALYISSGIPINQIDRSRPHILQCFGYFSSIATSDREDTPSSSMQNSPRGSTSKLDNNKSTNFRFHGFDGALTRSRSASNITSDQYTEQSFDADDFHFQSILGLGRAKVCYEQELGIAIKHCDLFKNPEMLHELRNEVDIYHALLDLQGIYIPELKFFGHWQGLYCIGLSVHGTVPNFLDIDQKERIIAILDIIHGYGILHGDIKKENLLLDDAGNTFIIDFGFSKKNVSLEEQEIEREELIHCLSLL